MTTCVLATIPNFPVVEVYKNWKIVLDPNLNRYVGYYPCLIDGSSYLTNSCETVAEVKTIIDQTDMTGWPVPSRNWTPIILGAICISAGAILIYYLVKRKSG